MAFSVLVILVGFLFSLSVHEAAHAWMSDQLGDPTARLAGRATLNPAAHLDPLGILLPFFLMLSGSPIIFGWGKPVPFDPFNLRSPRRDSALISLAGPTANLILALILSIIIRLSHFFLGPVTVIIELFLAPVVSLNVTWAFFNLLPFHPLDGGKVLVGFLPQDLAYKVDDILNQYGLIILIFLIFPFFGESLVATILSPIVKVILALLLPGTSLT